MSRGDFWISRTQSYQGVWLELGAYENRGYLIGVLVIRDPTTWGSILGVLYFRKPPTLSFVLELSLGFRVWVWGL